MYYLLKDISSFSSYLTFLKKGLVEPIKNIIPELNQTPHLDVSAAHVQPNCKTVSQQLDRLKILKFIS